MFVGIWRIKPVSSKKLQPTHTGRQCRRGQPVMCLPVRACHPSLCLGNCHGWSDPPRQRNALCRISRTSSVILLTCSRMAWYGPGRSVGRFRIMFCKLLTDRHSCSKSTWHGAVQNLLVKAAMTLGNTTHDLCAFSVMVSMTSSLVSGIAESRDALCALPASSICHHS